MNNKYNFDSISFGMRLTKIRNFHKKTQEQVAELVGVSVKSVQNWESGSKIPGIDNLVALATCYGMTAGEILEDEAYRIFEKKFDFRKRTIETIEIEDYIEVFMDFTEDKYFDRYEVWIWDEFARHKYMYCSMEKVISYNDFKKSMLQQSKSIVTEYRQWLFNILSDNAEDMETKEQIEKKMRCEKAGMAERGAVCIDGKVMYFDN